MMDKGVVKDRDHIRFQGLEAKEYTVTLPDTAPPEIADFEPKNSAVNVLLDTVLRLKFSEPVAAGDAADAKILLIALGNVQPNGSRAADKVVASIPINSKAEISFSGNVLQLDIGR